MTTTHFDEDHWRDRLEADARPYDGGNGFYSVVLDLGPRGDRKRKPEEVFNSRVRYSDAGIFKESEDAAAFAARYKDALIAQYRRVHQLRVLRGLSLAERLRESNTTIAQLEGEKSEIGNKIKGQKDRKEALIREANDPIVEIDLRPGSDRWQLFDAPSESEGTVQQSRQLVIEEGTGLRNPEPSDTEPKPKGKATRRRQGIDPNAVSWNEGGAE